MRLIDADELTRKCEKWLKQDVPDDEKMVPLADIAVSVIMEIEEQPTAYDVNGVIERLEEEREYSSADFAKYAEEHGIDEDDDWHFEGLKRAIKIVKEGR